jgi:hypothetical protein
VNILEKISHIFICPGIHFYSCSCRLSEKGRGAKTGSAARSDAARGTGTGGSSRSSAKTGACKTGEEIGFMHETQVLYGTAPLLRGPLYLS